MKLLFLIPLLCFVTIPAFAHIGFEPIYQPPSVTGGGPNEKYCVIGVSWIYAFNSTTNSFECYDVPASSLRVNNQTSQNDYFITGINNVTGGITTNQFSVNTTLCGSDFVSSIDNVTGYVTCTAAPTSSLRVNNQTSQNDYFVTGINNSTGIITTNQFSVNTTDCSSNFVSSINNVTGEITCNPSGSSGFTTISSAPQTTATILADNSTISNKATIKTLTQGIGITLTNGSNAVTIATTSGAFKNPLLDGSNHTDTEADAVTRGDIIVGTSASLWGELPIGSSGTVLKSDGTDPSWGSVSGAATSLSSNVTASNTSAYSNLWKIQLTANSGNVVNGVIVARTNTSGVAVQAGANLTSSAAAQGWCLWETPTGAATAPVIDFVVLSTTTTDTGETAWLPAINEPAPILFTCTITTGSSAPLIWINIQPEAAGTVTASAGSYYIKTP